jgi:hypothetical protein
MINRLRGAARGAGQLGRHLRRIALLGGLLASVALSASTVAHAQCPPVAGDRAFSGDPVPPCYEPEPVWPPIRLGAGAVLGVAPTDTLGLDGPIVGAEAFADVAIVGPLELGVRLAYQSAADDRFDGDADGFDDDDLGNAQLLLITAGPRVVLFTEPARREGFRFGVSGGWLGRLDDSLIGPASGPVVEVAVERQAGMLFSNSDYDLVGRTGTGHNFGLGVRYQQGLADAADYRAVLGTLSYALEVGVRLPEGAPGPRRKPALEMTLHGEALGGTVLSDRFGLGYGIGFELGFPFGRWVAAQARVDAMQLGGTELGDAAMTLSALGGVKIGRWFPIFAEVLFGWSHSFGTPLPEDADPRGIEPGWAVDVAVGAQLSDAFGCGIGAYVSQRTRIGIEPTTPTVVLAAVGLSYDNLIRAAECQP